MELGNNQLTGNDLEEISKLYPQLYKLKLNQNVIVSLDVLKSLQSTDIKKLSLVDNPCAKNSNYKREVFNMFPKLLSVDCETKEGEEIESTLYEEIEEGEEGGEFDEEDDEEFDEIEDAEEDDDELEDDDNEDEDEKPKKQKKN